MRCKRLIVFIIMTLIMVCKSNKIETLEDESIYIPNENIQEEPVEKSKEEKELEYWSKITGKEVIKVTKIECSLSFYTSLTEENGGYANLTASGKELNDMTIANNLYDFGQQIYIEGYGLKEVQDRGCSSFNNLNTFDIYIPRNYGDTDEEYYKRVNEMGRDYTVGYVFEYAN